MALTAWKTYASGDNATAADRNTYERDNGRWLSHNATGGAPMCRVYNSANLTISTATDTQLTYDSERFNLGGMHSTSVNTGRLTIPASSGGKYLAGVTFRFATGTAGAEYYGSLRHNATTPFARQGHPPVTGDEEFISVVGFYAFAAANYIDSYAYHAHGSDITVSAIGQYSPEFWAIWLGE